MRNLVLVLGDQLNRDSSAFQGFDPTVDAVCMAEVRGECLHVWSHKVRIAMFLSGMRHFAAALHRHGVCVLFRKLGDRANTHSLSGELEAAVGRLHPKKLIVTEPGEWRVLQDLLAAAARAKTPIEIRPDTHFLTTKQEFAAWASGRKQIRMEFFYRHMRQRYSYLMERSEPIGGRWNFDAENRKSLGKMGPIDLPPIKAFPPDAITADVIATVEREFPDHPGDLTSFNYPVTRRDALTALAAFIDHALPRFGDYQDAMWTSQPWLYHSRLSAALNLKLLDPREVVGAAEQAYHDGYAPLTSVEGFVRQILGWREYVRGVYWLYMPEYLERNHLDAHRKLPGFYWTGKTDMNCLREALGQTLKYGYAHHIQRLMVIGLFSLLLGVEPKQVHEWYLAIYVDAVEWVELPNTLGMSQYGDGGVMGSKPYVASGKYIQRMSNYCAGCRYDPGESTGERACPFTTLYWDFLMRHQSGLAGNPRMTMQLKNLVRIAPADQREIREQAEVLRERFSGT